MTVIECHILTGRAMMYWAKNGVYAVEKTINVCETIYTLNRTMKLTTILRIQMGVHIQDGDEDDEDDYTYCESL